MHQRQALDGTNEAVFNSGVEIDFEGRFEVCEMCLSEAAHELGWVSQRIATEMMATIATQEAKIASLTDALSDRSQACVVLGKQLSEMIAPADEAKLWSDGYDEGFAKGLLRADLEATAEKT